MYYYSTMRLILIYCSSEGGRLSRPRHCSQCAACVKSCVSQWFSWKHKLLSAARFEPGPSRATGKRVTTRPLRPDWLIDWLFLAGETHGNDNEYDGLEGYQPDTTPSVYTPVTTSTQAPRPREVRWTPGRPDRTQEQGQTNGRMQDTGRNNSLAPQAGRPDHHYMDVIG